MKITYKIEQYDVDNFKVIITSPEYLNEVFTRIHNPHFLLSELRQNIEINLTKNIHRFCNKNKQYADILRNKSFEFEPDEYDRYEKLQYYLQHITFLCLPTDSLQGKLIGK
jgi:hypothetical protein